MNRITVVLFFLFTAFISHAQLSPQEQDYRTVFLKDGSVIKGYLVVEQPSSDGIKIRVISGDEMYIPNEYIKKIKKPKKRLVYLGEGRTVKGIGYYGALHINSFWGYGSRRGSEFKETRVGGGLHFVFGNKRSEAIAYGIGTGLDMYPQNFLIPVFADVRGVWFEKAPGQFNLAYNLILGYSFHSGIVFPNFEGNTWKGGVLIYPNIGVRIARRRQTNILLDIGYKFQHSSHEFTRGWNSSHGFDEIFYKSLTLRMGWVF